LSVRAGEKTPARAACSVWVADTVWNRHAERDGGRYISRSKLRPRSEWIIQRDTHEALITDDEAEAILAVLESGKRRAAKRTARVYLLSGLLVAPDGAPWNGDGGFYRLGKGTRISAEAVDKAIVGKVIERFSSDEMAEEIAAHYRRLAERAVDTGQETAAMRRRMAEIERRIAKLTALLAETTAPGALLRQIEAMEAERDALASSLEGCEGETRAARAMRNLSASDVKRMLTAIAEDLNAARPEDLQDTLRQILERVVLDPDTFDAVITYRIAPASKAGSRWRPHGDSNPGYRRERAMS
jgi:site-specific DNA recombinase